MNEWVRINNYNFSVIVHIILRRTGGGEANCRLGRVVIINVVSRLTVIPNSEDNDPATAFRIRMTRLSGSEDAPELPSPENMERLSRPGGEYKEAGFEGDLAKTPPAGFVPIAFAADKSDSVLTTYCPVYRAFHHPDDAPLNEDMTTIVGDLCSVFVDFVRNGIVLRSSAGGLGGDPVTGKMVRGRKKWIWRRDPQAWQSVDILMALDRSPRMTAIPVKTLWTRFQQW